MMVKSFTVLKVREAMTTTTTTTIMVTQLVVRLAKNAHIRKYQFIMKDEIFPGKKKFRVLPTQAFSFFPSMPVSLNEKLHLSLKHVKSLGLKPTIFIYINLAYFSCFQIVLGSSETELRLKVATLVGKQWHVYPTMLKSGRKYQLFFLVDFR